MRSFQHLWGGPPSMPDAPARAPSPPAGAERAPESLETAEQLEQLRQILSGQVGKTMGNPWEIHGKMEILLWKSVDVENLKLENMENENGNGFLRWYFFGFKRGELMGWNQQSWWYFYGDVEIEWRCQQYPFKGSASVRASVRKR